MWHCVSNCRVLNRIQKILQIKSEKVNEKYTDAVKTNFLGEKCFKTKAKEKYGTFCSKNVSQMETMPVKCQIGPVDIKLQASLKSIQVRNACFGSWKVR